VKIIKSAAMVLCLAISGMAITSYSAHAVVIASTVYGSLVDALPQDGIADQLVPTFIQVFNDPAAARQSRGIIEFDISSLSSPISSATLNLSQANSDLTNVQTFSVYGFTGDGSIGSSDYGLGSFLTSFDHQNEATEIIDITTFINSQILLNDANHFAGIQITVDITPSNESVLFANRFLPHLNPTLSVEAATIAEPAPLALLGLGIAGVMFARRKRAA